MNDIVTITITMTFSISTIDSITITYVKGAPGQGDELEGVQTRVLGGWGIL